MSALQKYRACERILRAVRREGAHGAVVTRQENELLHEMEDLWWRLTPTDRVLLEGTAPPEAFA